MKKPVALITGASGGLGEALAHELAKRGYDLILTARRIDKLTALQSILEKQGTNVKIQAMDVMDFNQTAQDIEKLDQETDGLDLVIANAGIGKPEFAPTLKWEQSRNTLLTNVMGASATLLPLVPRMITRKRGHLVGISSLAGEVPAPGSPAYGASKACLSFMLLSLREELKQAGVFVTDVHPGFMKSDMTQKNKFPMPFLISTQEGARIIANGIAAKKTLIRFPWPLTLLSALNKKMPAAIRDPFMLSQLKV